MFSPSLGSSVWTDTERVLTILFAPIAVATGFDDRSEGAPKIGSIAICYLKTPITAGLAMSASSALVSSTLTRKNRAN
jgi:hypothetical protein